MAKKQEMEPRLRAALAKIESQQWAINELGRSNQALLAQIEAQRSDGSVLGEAAAIVAGPRQQAYGHPIDNYGTLAEMLSGYLTRRGTTRIDAHDAIMFNILQKVAREATSRKRDNLVDIAGYARCAEMLADPKPVALAA